MNTASPACPGRHPGHATQGRAGQGRARAGQGQAGQTRKGGQGNTFRSLIQVTCCQGGLLVRPQLCQQQPCRPAEHHRPRHTPPLHQPPQDPLLAHALPNTHRLQRCNSWQAAFQLVSSRRCSASRVWLQGRIEPGEGLGQGQAGHLQGEGAGLVRLHHCMPGYLQQDVPWLHDGCGNQAQVTSKASSACWGIEGYGQGMEVRQERWSLLHLVALHA